MHWPNEVNIVVVTALQDTFRADIACVNEVVFRSQLLVRELRLDRLQRVVILLGRWCGFDLRNEMRQVVVATFGEMHFVADPVKIAFTTIAYFDVVGRTMPFADWQHLLGRQALRVTIDPTLVLRPGLLQDMNGG